MSHAASQRARFQKALVDAESIAASELKIAEDAERKVQSKLQEVMSFGNTEMKESRCDEIKQAVAEISANLIRANVSEHLVDVIRRITEAGGPEQYQHWLEQERAGLQSEITATRIKVEEKANPEEAKYEELRRTFPAWLHQQRLK